MSALGLLLALASSATWGVADFWGGLVSRRLPTIAVTVISQLGGFIVVLVALRLQGSLDHRSFWIGILAGLGGGSGLAAFYRALALGTMSIVSPLAACGAVVPFVIAIATGERPSALSFVGAGLALTGAVLASLEEHRSEAPDRSRAVLLAVVAAVLLGVFTYFLGLGGREGDALSTLVGARVGSLAFLLGLAVVIREKPLVPRSSLATVAAIGVCDMSANALFAFASSHGLLALVSVLGSLYPIVTVMLAHLVLHERLSTAQKAGVGAALVGVAALAAG